MTSRALLKVRGIEYGGWISVLVTRSLEEAAGSFDLEVSQRYPGTEGPPILIAPGDGCEVSIAGTKVITGHVDAVEPTLTARSASIKVRGRSKTGQIVDCSALGTQYRRRSIEDIAADLCAPYGVSVVARTPTGEQIPRFSVEQGETVYEAIERAARLRALLVTDDADGRLVLTRVGSEVATDSLIEGANLLEISGVFDASVRYSEIRCKGQTAGNDDTSGEAAAQMFATAQDDEVGLHRVLVVLPEQRADAKRCQQRADWEAATRAGQSIAVQASVERWTQSNGAIWAPGQTAYVRSPFCGIDGDLLIVSCTYELTNAGGEICRMQLAPPGGYELLAPAERSRRKGKVSKPTKWFGTTDIAALARKRVQGAGKAQGQGVGQ